MSGHGLLAALGLVACGSLPGPSGSVLVRGVQPNELASDGSTLYWTMNAGVGSLSLAGGAKPSTLVADRTRAFGMALDASSIYFTDQGPSEMYEGAVLKMNRDGTGLTTMLDRLLNPYEIAVDATNVYWTSKDCVCEMSLDGVKFNLDVFEIWASAMAIDSAYIYYVDETNGTIARVPIGGGVTTVLATYPANDLALAGRSLFWSTRPFPGRIERLDLDAGGAPTTIATAADNDGMRQLVIDGDEIFWDGFDTVERAKLDGSHHEILSHQETAQGLAVDEGEVYWGSWEVSASGIKTLAK